ncbi:hypothetical protein EV383_0857 [Pseudonocardia sediminis]|uniref:Uncharacterized protein n=1 Tax=Pseudonocardia sediminis TaxID=1397368 RepID=A0A4Q7USS0_PSEST|nr:hypothetical protein [Pseudonocardia sediminis]RZT84024.1 hypothetical protein EV383_0857 [Pseudonocardia sediminis]
MTNALAVDDRPATPQPTRTTGEIVYDAGTVLTLYFGSLVIPVVGWIVGLVMLWEGPRWTRTQKWIGTLIWPVAIAAAGAVLFVVRMATDSTGLGVAFWAVVVPVLVALPAVFVYLLVAARRSGTTVH